MLVKTVYSTGFVNKYGNPEGTKYTTPTAKTEDSIFFIGNYPGEGKKISGYESYGTCVDTYLGNNAVMTKSTGTLPSKYSVFTINKVSGATSAKVTLEIAPNGTNETGSYLGTFMSETINLENVSGTFSTADIKYFDVTVNGKSTSATGISSDGKTFNIVGTNYGTTYNGASVRVTQYDSNGNVIDITTFLFEN